MKLSEVTLESVKRALRIDYDYDDERIREIIPMAKDRIVSLTNREEADLDNHPAIVHAFYCACADFYDGTDEHEKTILTLCHNIQLNMVT